MALTAAAVAVTVAVLWPGPDLPAAPSSAAAVVGPPAAVAAPPAAPRPMPPPDPPAVLTRWMTVEHGDTLAGIAAAHGTTWSRLAALNHLDRPDRIRPGMRLQLPEETP